jgi:methyl-accepting chemotaxis protein
MRLLPKLAAAMLLVAVSVTLAISSLATARQVRTMTEQYRSKGEAIALSLAYSLSPNTRETLAKNVGAVKELITASKTIAGVSYIYIQDWEQSILAHTFEPSFPPSFTETNWLERGALPKGERVKIAPSVNIDTPAGRIWAMDVAAPIRDSDLGVVHVGMDRFSIEREVGSLRRALIGVGLAVGAAGVLLGLGLALALFIRPLRHLTSVTSEIAARGDLTIPIRVGSRDEIGDLARAFVRMVDGLRGINGALQESARVLRASVAGLTATARDQQQTISQQAAALQQTHTTAQEIKQTSQAAARKAEGVLEVARQAETITASGETAIQQTVAAMTDMRAQASALAEKMAALSEASSQIGRITDTVKDLADQSNMLALNAAIEAVRSGEHGKGFAVVAREIRNLADESIRATKGVREVLDDVSRAVSAAATMARAGEDRMESGLSQVKASKDNLRALAEIVRGSSTAAQQIAEAVNQQDAGINQIFDAVRDLSTTMEETVQRLEQTGQAAGSVQEVSEKVSKLADSYRV